ncbi:MAG TPA: hypothetical protein VFZ25_00400 [Chloroflexota bacterium]|nr:hypothetical protein [Chloroflexota bacterium]
MKTIETVAVVTEERTITIQVPADIEPGEHRVVIIVGELESTQCGHKPLDLPRFEVGPWPADLPLRRGDLYDDCGR